MSKTDKVDEMLLEMKEAFLGMFSEEERDKYLRLLIEIVKVQNKRITLLEEQISSYGDDAGEEDWMDEPLDGKIGGAVHSVLYKAAMGDEWKDDPLNPDNMLAAVILPEHEQRMPGTENLSAKEAQMIEAYRMGKACKSTVKDLDRLLEE
jgi:hypothetical protein